MEKYMKLEELSCESLIRLLDNTEIPTKIKAMYIYNLTHIYNDMIDRLNYLGEQNKHLEYILNIASEERKELENDNYKLKHALDMIESDIQ